MEYDKEDTEFVKALCAFQAEVGSVGKDSTNPFFKSKYASLENIITTIKPLLAKHGLAYAQFPDGDGLTTAIMHVGGGGLKATATLHLKGQTPQDQGSAITYMRRYALSAALGLATEEDDDGNAASKPQTKLQKPSVVVEAEKKEKELKAEIKKLIDGKVINPLEQTAEAYETYCVVNTGMNLVPKNYKAIIELLKK